MIGDDAQTLHIFRAKFMYSMNSIMKHFISCTVFKYISLNRGTMFEAGLQYISYEVPNKRQMANVLQHLGQDLCHSAIAIGHEHLTFTVRVKLILKFDEV